jgi:ribosomal protein S12 methylthiotransferase
MRFGVGSNVISTCGKLRASGQTALIFGDGDAPVPETKRMVSTGPGWAYIKIAEGCDNRCAYCAIPDIRGRFRSRPMENILAEAETLAKKGVRELIVVAQDITRYGLDLYGSRRLHQLIEKLCNISGIDWIGSLPVSGRIDDD